MFANWGRLLFSRSTTRYAVKPLGPQLRGAVAITQFPPIAQRRALAAAAGNKKPSSSKRTSAKKTTAVKKTGSAKKATQATRKTATLKKAPLKKAPLKKALLKKSPLKKGAASVRKSSTRKPAAKKIAARKSAPKKSAAKRAVVTRPKKKKDPEVVKKEKLRETVKALKGKILDPPGFRGAVNPWNEFFASKAKANKGVSMDLLWKQHGQEWRQEYQNLSPAELESLKQVQAKRAQATQAALRDWVVAHTPAEIHEANQARRRLRLMQKQDDPPHGIKTLDLKEIPDGRIPKAPRNELMMFVIDRLKSYNGQGKQKVEYIMGLGNEYKKLSDGEKAKFKQLAAQDKARYYYEMKNVGIEPHTVAKKSAKA